MTMPNHSHFQLGRLHRTYNPRIPHLSALLAGQTLPPPPPSVDYTKGMPANLGMMLNDTLGDCTCAAVYHAIQVWSFNALKKMDTEPDADVEKLYELACGYNPREGGEGPGGNEQHVLTYLLKQGAPTGPTGTGRHKIAAFVEVDPRNVDDVKRTIAASPISDSMSPLILFRRRPPRPLLCGTCRRTTPRSSAVTRSFSPDTTPTARG
jgi:hypothetical protein